MDDLILEGKELLDKIDELSNETEENIIKSCGYSLKFGFSKASKRSFFRNFAEAYIKSGKPLIQEKEGLEFKEQFLDIREREFLGVLPNSISDGYGRWVSTLLLLGVPKIIDNGKLKLGVKRVIEKCLELGLSPDEINSYRFYDHSLPKLTSKQTIEKEFPELDISKVIFDNELLTKTESLSGFSRRHIAIECGYILKENAFQGETSDGNPQSGKVTADLQAFGRALKLANGAPPIPVYKLYNSYLRKEVLAINETEEKSLNDEDFIFKSETNQTQEVSKTFIGNESNTSTRKNIELISINNEIIDEIELTKDLKIEENKRLTGQKLKKFVLELSQNSISETSICIRSGYEIDKIGSFRRAFSKSADVTFGPLPKMIRELKQKSIESISQESNLENEELFIDRESSIAISKRKIRSAKFRDEVLTLHGYKCACCEIKIGKLLEAAHIIPVTKNGSDSPSNGIPLCPTHHTAFDNLLFTFDPDDLSIILSERITESELGITSNNITQMADKEALKIRLDFFKKRGYF